MRMIPAFIVCTLFASLLSCKKESGSPTPTIPPYLTGKLWQLDTILINPPATYDNLTSEQKFSYSASLGWAKDKARLTFMTDGTVICSGDWDLGYTGWQLVNNENDIKVNQGTGYDLLRSWQASAAEFSYIHSLGTEPFDCTYVYR